MALKTRPVRLSLLSLLSAPLAGAKINAQLSLATPDGVVTPAYETDGVDVVPLVVTLTEDPAKPGDYLGNFWPNTRGLKGTRWLINVAAGELLMKAMNLTVIDDSASVVVPLAVMVDVPPYAPVFASSQLVGVAQGYADAAGRSATLAVEAAAGAAVNVLSSSQGSLNAANAVLDTLFEVDGRVRSINVYAADRAIASTFSGWRSAVDYAGLPFDAIRTRLTLEAPCSVKMTVLDASLNIVASTTRRCEDVGSAWRVFKLPTLLSNASLTTPVMYVSFEVVSQPPSRMMIPDVTRNSAANSQIYPSQYLTTASNAWYGPAVGFDLIVQLINSAQVGRAAVRRLIAFSGGNVTQIRAINTFQSDNAIASTFTGFKSSMDFTGTAFDTLRTRFTVEAACEVILSLMDPAGAVLRTARKPVPAGSNWHTFSFDELIDASVITGPVFYVAVETANRATRLMLPSGVRTSATDEATYLGGYVTSAPGWYTSNYPSYNVIAQLIDSRSAVFQPAPAVVPPEIVPLAIADYIYAKTGAEMNVYFEGLLSASSRDYEWDVDCGIGKHQNNRFTTVPAATGDYPLQINVHDKKTWAMLGTVTSMLRVVAPPAVKTVNLLVIGDSTTFVGEWQQEVLNLAAVEGRLSVQLIGTQGIAPNKHEGYSGWSTNLHFTGAASPFVFAGAFNFPQYMSAHAFAAVDIVTIHLGINDIFNEESPAAATAKAKAAQVQTDAMIASMKAFNPAVKIGLMLAIPPAAQQDAFGAAYGTYKTRAQYKRNWAAWVAAMSAYYGGKTAQNIHLISTNSCLDTENNMQAADVAVNSRNPTLVSRQFDGVHPAVAGYKQMADAVWYWLRGVA